MKKLKTNTQTKQRLVTLLILVLIMVILSCISNKYLTVNNLINIVRQESTLIIIACAATMLMISGGMDLSPAGVIALTSVVFAKLCVAGISIPLAALLSLLVGVAAGTFSGLLVVLANVPPMIATLGNFADKNIEQPILLRRYGTDLLALLPNAQFHHQKSLPHSLCGRVAHHSVSPFGRPKLTAMALST